MNIKNIAINNWYKLAALISLSTSYQAIAAGGAGNPNFPKSLESYSPLENAGVMQTLTARFAENPFNLVATGIFFLAICHTFCASTFMNLSHKLQHDYEAEQAKKGKAVGPNDVSFKAQMLHYLGEVEAIFGIWVIALIAAIWASYDLNTVIDYVGHKVNFTEPMFVVVIMSLAATKPVLSFTEQCLKVVANFGKGTPAAWWLTILTLAPILGSFITEPAAMTIAALLLGKQFYSLQPTNKFKYATLGLLFVNISVGGTLTNFAAPPVLMVAAPWKWSSSFMLENFGWKAIVGILIANAVYFLLFKKEFGALNKTKEKLASNSLENENSDKIPFWITLTHIVFMGWTVFMAHYPALFIGGFLFFLGFYSATPQHQSKLELKSAMLVGFFLAGLVIHGGLQAWWIQPVLSSFGETSLMIVSTALTGFNDNAAITYLSTLVPNFSDELKYAVMAGAVTGGGLTVIANAPNPAGQAILNKYFDNKAIKPMGLLVSALIPTVILGLCFMLMK